MSFWSWLNNEVDSFLDSEREVGLRARNAVGEHIGAKLPGAFNDEQAKSYIRLQHERAYASPEYPDRPSLATVEQEAATAGLLHWYRSEIVAHETRRVDTRTVEQYIAAELPNRLRQ